MKEKKEECQKEQKEKKEPEQPRRLRPVLFNASIGSRGYNYYAPDKGRQLLLLKALKVTQDPKKLKEMIGVSTVASVYRMLDRISATKEYHKALAGNGVTMDFIVSGVKREAESGEKSSDRLKAYSILMKSLGIDKYEESGIVGGSWEDILVKKVEGERKQKMIEGEIIENEEIGEYEVIQPQLPESVKKTKELENETVGGLYE